MKPKPSNPARIHVKPKRPGLKVAFAPARQGNRHLHPDGEVVVDSTHWRRRENKDEVVVTAVPTPGDEPATPATPKKASSK